MNKILKDQITDIIENNFDTLIGEERGPTNDKIVKLSKFSVESIERLLDTTNVVSCVYCGLEYPSGTPTSKHATLTDHISKCEKHPLVSANQRIKKLENLLRIAVRIIEDDTVFNNEKPVHDCDFNSNPDQGFCYWCDWYWSSKEILGKLD